MAQDDHYVSQTYLKEFTNSDGYLVPYYKNGRVIIGKPKRPKSVCHEEDGDSNSYFEDPRILDQYLSMFENSWAKNIESLTNIEGGADTKYEIAGYITFLRLCNPVAKRLGTGLLSETIQPLAEKVIADSIKEPGTPPEIIELYEKHQNEPVFKVDIDPEYVHARAITGLVDNANRLYCSDWLVLINKSDAPFVTSDNPAVLYYREDFSLIANTYIPLSPSMAVLITPNYTEEAPNLEEVQNFSHQNDRFADIKEEYVATFNQLIVQSAENMVLSSESHLWLEQLVDQYRDWRVETITKKAPIENGELMMLSQRAIDTKNA